MPAVISASLFSTECRQCTHINLRKRTCSVSIWGLHGPGLISTVEGLFGLERAIMQSFNSHVWVLGLFIDHIGGVSDGSYLQTASVC